MRLTSFTETTAGAAATIRDPRIIDLAQCTGATSTSALPNGGGGHAIVNAHHHLPLPPIAAAASNFNTLPAHLSGGGGGIANHNLAAMQLAQAAAGALHHHHNTLPARVGESPPRALATSSAVAAASGRHFKPFDHRRMNPMAEIQENPYELQVSRTLFSNLIQNCKAVFWSRIILVEPEPQRETDSVLTAPAPILMSNMSSFKKKDSK
jgi:hypothetical protein